VALKLWRLVVPGPRPEIEMRSHLREVGFRNAPSVLAAFQWKFGADRPADSAWVGMLQRSIDNQGEAWEHAVAAAHQYLARASRRRRPPPQVASIVPSSLWGGSVDPDVDDLIGSYLRVVERLGETTAELHRALATPTSDSAFAPDAFSPFSRRSAYQRMRTLTVSVIDALRSRAPALEPDVRELADAMIQRRTEALAVFQQLLDRRVTSRRIRCHGNLHLGQVLHVGDDLVIINFDGEPGRPVYERRLKHSPLQDVATMVRSLHYAAHAALERQRPRQRRDAHDVTRTTEWIRAWQSRVGAAFVNAYSKALAGAGLLPADPEDTRVLFRSYLLERAIYEVGAELNRRSDWVRAPLLDLPSLLGRT
jgi:trehalose synthase-fused probable maltokinase